MNFDPVGVASDGEPFMKYTRPFTIIERIQLLQRWILVNSFSYYQLDENIVHDFKYDDNAHQLVAMLNEFPEEAKRSRYYVYFYDYTGETGYHLIGRVKEKDPELYRHIWIDAMRALQLKHERQGVNA